MDEENKKIKFFKRLWYSISKIERYPDMAAEGFKSALGYLVKVVAIFTFIVCIGIVYKTTNLINTSVNYLKNDFPDFSYKNGILEVDSDKEIKISANEAFAENIIVDTKTEEEAKINQYINEIIENGEGILVLKDRIIIKNISVVGTISYSYEEAFKQVGISEFTKQDVINYVSGTQIISLYLSLFLTIFVYSFIMYFLTTISNVVLLSAFGYITTLLARIKMRYVAVFNMSIYAITLSVILNMLYVGVNLFITFNMEYFQVMYIAVSAIYLVAAILILKTDFVKKQMELMKISEMEKKVKDETDEQKEEKQEEKETEKSSKDEKESVKENNKETEEKDKSENKTESKEKEQKDKQSEEKGKKKENNAEKNNKENTKSKQEKKNKSKKKKEKLDIEPEGSNA